jgi:primosomal protein N'
VKPTQTECPHCPHWMELHNDDGSCGCGASHPTIGENPDER